MDLTKVKFRPILDEIMNSSELASSAFLSGYKSFKHRLIVSLWTEWRQQKQPQPEEHRTEFVVLTANHVKEQLMQSALDEILDDGNIKDQINVKTAADFFWEQGVKPTARFIIIVDILIPDVSAWDYATYFGTAVWNRQCINSKKWCRVCLLSSPLRFWNLECKSYTMTPILDSRTCSVQEIQESTITVPCELDDEQSTLELAGQVESQIRSITGKNMDALILILCTAEVTYMLLETIPTELFISHRCIQLSSIEQTRLCQKQKGQPTILWATMSIAHVLERVCVPDAIICIGQLERPVHRYPLRSTPVTISCISTGELEACRCLLQAKERDGPDPALIQLSMTKDTPEPQRQLHVDPFVILFLAIGMSPGCRVLQLIRGIDILMQVETFAYIDILIESSLVEVVSDSKGSLDQFSTSRKLALHGEQAQQAFRLMLQSGRGDSTDIGFFWLEAGLSFDYSSNIVDHFEQANVALAMTKLISIHRPRPGEQGFRFIFNFSEKEDVLDPVDGCVGQINRLLPEYLQSWMDKGALWLRIFLFDIAQDNKSFLSNFDEAHAYWCDLPKPLLVAARYMRSVYADNMELTHERTHIMAKMFKHVNTPVTTEFVNKCYESVSRLVLKAFSHRLVKLYINNDGILTAFEVATAVNHGTSPNELNYVLQAQIGSKGQMFAIYFTIRESKYESDLTLIDDILVIPTHIVREWGRESGVDIYKPLLRWTPDRIC